MSYCGFHVQLIALLSQANTHGVLFVSLHNFKFGGRRKKIIAFWLILQGFLLLGPPALCVPSPSVLQPNQPVHPLRLR